MNTGLDAYKSVQSSTLTGRRLEAHVLLRAADHLQRVIDDWGSDGHESRLADAVSRTQMLWSFFQDALTSGDSPLPDETKANLLKLSIFIDLQLLATLSDPTPDKLVPVIEIHRNLSAGLSTSPARPVAA